MARRVPRAPAGVRHAALLVALLATVAVLVAVAYGLARPGCSLWPEDPRARDGTAPGTAADACAALGEPLPEPLYLPVGFRRHGISIGAPPRIGDADPPVPSISSVRVSYGREQPRMSIDIVRPTIEPGLREAGEIRLGPYLVNVSDTPRPDGGVADRSYRFARGQLLFIVHIAIEDDVTREVADRIVASIR